MGSTHIPQQSTQQHNSTTQNRMFSSRIISNSIRTAGRIAPRLSQNVPAIMSRSISKVPEGAPGSSEVNEGAPGPGSPTRGTEPPVTSKHANKRILPLTVGGLVLAGMAYALVVDTSSDPM